MQRWPEPSEYQNVCGPRGAGLCNSGESGLIDGYETGGSGDAPPTVTPEPVSGDTRPGRDLDVVPCARCAGPLEVSAMRAPTAA
jgi:hypothetical protein